MTPATDTPTAAGSSSSSLLKGTVIALVTAMLILVVAVLPAEYGVDPTGLGRVLGLTEMGEIKQALAREAAAGAAADVPAANSPAAPAEVAPPSAAAIDSAWTHTTQVPLAPGEGKEVKLLMAKGARASFEWSTTGGPVNHDTHGDSTGAPKSYINYRKGTGVERDSGELVALMDGAHGWFWRNRGKQPVVVTLRTRGEYAELKKMY